MRGAPVHTDIPRYILCSSQYALTVASASANLSGGGKLYAYLYREVDSRNHATICDWRAYASGTSTVTAKLGFLGCGGPIYSSVTGSGSAMSGEDSDSSDAPFYAQAVQSSTSATTGCTS